MSGYSYGRFLLHISYIISLFIVLFIAVHGAPLQVRRPHPFSSDAVDMIALQLLPFYSHSSPSLAATSFENDIDSGSDATDEQPFTIKDPQLDRLYGLPDEGSFVETNDQKSKRSKRLRKSGRKRALGLFAHWPSSAVSPVANPTGTQVSRKASPWLRWG